MISLLIICFALFGSTANLLKNDIIFNRCAKKEDWEGKGEREREVRMSWKSTFAGTAKNVAFTQILNFEVISS